MIYFEIVESQSSGRDTHQQSRGRRDADVYSDLQVSVAASRDRYTICQRSRLRTDYGHELDLIATTFREERDVHRFVDSTLRAWLEIILWLWIIVDDQPVANVARSATVRSDSFHRATEPHVKHSLHRMPFRP